MNIILIENLKENDEIKYPKGTKGKMKSNVKFSYLVEFEDGKEEWIAPHMFEFIK